MENPRHICLAKHAEAPFTRQVHNRLGKNTSLEVESTLCT